MYVYNVNGDLSGGIVIFIYNDVIYIIDFVIVGVYGYVCSYVGIELCVCFGVGFIDFVGINIFRDNLIL